MNKREYDFDVESFKKDGLDAEDIEIIQDIIDKSVKEATDEIDQLVEENREQLDKEWDELMSIEDLNERHKKMLEIHPDME